MANYAVLKAAVAAVVKTNGNQEITGNNLQLQLINIINTLTEGYQFLGVATPATEYTAGDANVAFIAGQMGTYADMGNLTLASGEVAVLKYNGSAWSKETLLNIGNFSDLFLPRPSDALVDTDGAGTEQEFTFRKSGGDGGAYYRKIKGKTLAWNQLVSIPASPQSRTIGGITITDNRDGSYTLSGTATERVSFYQFATPFGVITGHRYLIKGCPVGGSFSTYCISDGNRSYNNSTADIGNGWLFEAVDSNPISMRIRIESGTTINNLTFKPQLIDITLLGESITTAADFLALYPDAYYPYNAGTLISNDAEAVETTGRNQYNPATGKAQVIGGQTYYIGGTYTSLSQEGVAITPAADGTFTPASTGEVEVVGGNATDTIINLSDADNGLWQPYWKRTLQLGITTRKDTDGNVPFADGMKGAGTAADWADKVGGEKRMKRVNLGSLEWVYVTNNPGQPYFNVQSPADSAAVVESTGINSICARYAKTTATEMWTGSEDKAFIMNGGFWTGGKVLAIRDSAYTDAAAFKAAMQGVYLDYELAAPVPFTWAEPLNLGVKVDENGTERAVAPEGATAPSAPFVADTTYTKSVEKLVAETSAAQTKADVLALVRANEDALLSALKTAEVITDYTLADTADADTGVFAVVINPE